MGWIFSPLTSTLSVIGKLALKFTLSKSVTSLLPPGDPKLFNLALKFVKNYSPISDQEIEELKEFSYKINPIGSDTEIFI